MCMSTPAACTSACQKRASDPNVGGYEPPCGCWELNSGPLEEQSMLLPTEPSLQPAIPYPWEMYDNTPSLMYAVFLYMNLDDNL